MNELLLMKNRLGYQGGIPQQDRMIKDKRNTLNKVILYSYQGARVRKVDDSEETKDPALINPNKVKQNYDDKIISIGYEYGYKPGTVFEWINTGTKWLIYLQDMTELAYFKGDIRRCNFEIKWKDADEEDEEKQIKSTYAAIRGPVETKINYLIKEHKELDTPNHSLNILMPKNEDTIKYFKRYSKFYLQSEETQEKEICWRVEAIDSISTPGILEVIAVEYYSNLDEDNIEEGIVGDLIVKPIPPEPSDPSIEGPVFIMPKREYTYSCASGTWVLPQDAPVDYHIEGNTITIKWRAAYSGQFSLKCGDKEKVIVVQSLM